MGVTIIQQFRHLGPFTHPPSSSPSVDHGQTNGCKPTNHIFHLHCSALQDYLLAIKARENNLCWKITRQSWKRVEYSQV